MSAPSLVRAVLVALALLGASFEPTAAQVGADGFRNLQHFPQDIARDWAELQDAMRAVGKDPSDTLVAHENFLHLVMTDDPAQARDEQHRAFLRVMSSERGPRYLESVYLFGTLVAGLIAVWLGIGSARFAVRLARRRRRRHDHPPPPPSSPSEHMTRSSS